MISSCARLRNICFDHRIQMEPEFISDDGQFYAGHATWARAPRFVKGSPVEYTSPATSPIGGEIGRGERRTTTKAD